MGTYVAMRPPTWLIVVLVGALIGIVFAGLSTYDFVQHLDRQVHSLHCSFIPGMGAGAGESGCQVAMMSTYSSVFRSRVWGGIPISLPAMAVFAFIAFYGLDLLLTRRTNDRRATWFLALACGLPAFASIAMLTISLAKLGTVCKLCVAIYVASAMVLTGAIIGWRKAVKLQAPEPPATNRFLGIMFGVGVAFVAVPILLYLALAPDHSKFLGTCDNLTKSDDPYGVMIHMDRNASANAVPAIEILDPLCPACKAFEDRLDSSGLGDRLDRKAILFPLDKECNWMISETTHPGACTVSEAVLCAGDRAPDVLKWAFEVQESVREETKKDPAAAGRMVKQRFPELASCIGSADARSKLNKSMRWAVNHNIRVLTPQLFVDNVKLCDEDVDLGLEYALSRIIDAHDRGVRLGPPPAEMPPPPAMPENQHGTTPPSPEKKKAKPAADEPKPLPPAPAPVDEPKPVTTPTETSDKPAPPPPPPEPLPPEEPAGSGGPP